MVKSAVNTPELVILDPAEVVVSERLRAVDEAWVEAIGASMATRGQDTPIQVRRNGGGKLHLVAGAHRLAACKQEGLNVRAEVITCTDLEARLIEIDENLFRRELNPLDRAVFLAERKKVYLEMFPETRKGAKNQHAKGGLLNDTMSFSRQTAERIKLSQRSVERAIHIAENIPADLRARLIGTPWADKQADLLYLASLAESTQRRAMALVFDGAAKSLKAAVAQIDGTAAPEPSSAERQYARLIDAWNRSGVEVRSHFLAHLREIGALSDQGWEG